MKNERIKSAIKRVKIAYGIENAVDVSQSNPLDSEPILDPETMRHQGFTDKILRPADIIGMATIYTSAIGYVVYKAAAKVPEVIGQLSQIPDSFYEYVRPFINS